MNARKNTTSSHMKTTPRKSRAAALAVAAALVAVLGVARAVLMSSSAGSVAADPAAATQVVEAQFATAKAENVLCCTAGQCCDLALKVFNEDGQAANVKVSDLIEGGGTYYYNVEFDRYREHFRVQVDAVIGKVLGAVSTSNNQITTYDADGTYLDTAEM